VRIKVTLERPGVRDCSRKIYLGGITNAVAKGSRKGEDSGALQGEQGN
jgi:hypothetical protein